MLYLVSYGLGSYINQMTIRETVEGHSYFKLQFDGTVTAQVKKQLDLSVHYWSEVDCRIKIKYLMSFMFCHAKAKDVVT